MNGHVFLMSHLQRETVAACVARSRDMPDQASVKLAKMTSFFRAWALELRHIPLEEVIQEGTDRGDRRELAKIIPCR